MNIGKSRFDFNVSNIGAAENAIRDFLQLHKFKQVDTNRYYMYDPIMTGKTNFEYYINGNSITIFAYLGKPEKPIMLDDELRMAMGKQTYLSQLNVLFTSLNNLNGMGNQVNNNQNQYMANQAYNTQEQQVNKEQTFNQYGQPINQNTYGQAQNYQNNSLTGMSAGYDKWATISLVMSIIGVIGLCVGGIGLLYNMIVYYVAGMGLKSNKRGQAIAAMIINSLVMVGILVILVFQIIGIFVG